LHHKFLTDEIRTEIVEF